MASEIENRLQSLTERVRAYRLRTRYRPTSDNDVMAIMRGGLAASAAPKGVRQITEEEIAAAEAQDPEAAKQSAEAGFWQRSLAHDPREDLRRTAAEQMAHWLKVRGVSEQQTPANVTPVVQEPPSEPPIEERELTPEEKHAAEMAEQERQDAKMEREWARYLERHPPDKFAGYRETREAENGCWTPFG